MSGRRQAAGWWQAGSAGHVASVVQPLSEQTRKPPGIHALDRSFAGAAGIRPTEPLPATVERPSGSSADHPNRHDNGRAKRPGVELR
jgi:hypothetical protein